MRRWCKKRDVSRSDVLIASLIAEVKTGLEGTVTSQVSMIGDRLAPYIKGSTVTIHRLNLKVNLFLFYIT